MSNTANLGLPLIAESQASAEIPHNEALTRLDALAQIAVLDRDLATPPGSPSAGDTYLIAASGTGAWSGHDGDIAVYSSGWLFTDVKPGMVVYVRDEEKLIVRTNAGAWVTALPVPGATTASAVLGSSYSATTSFVDSGLSVALPSAGTYLILATLRGSANASGGLIVKLYNSTAAADVDGVSYLLAYSDAGIVQASAAIFGIATVGVASTIKIYAKGLTGTGDQLVTDVNGSSKIFAVKIA